MVGTLAKMTAPFSQRLLAQLFADLLPIYLEADDDVRAQMDDALATLNDPEAPQRQRDAMLDLLAAGLFPDEPPQLIARETFGERVRTLMEAQGFTQSDLAAAMGIGQSAVSEMLRRDSRPQRRTVERVAEALGVDPERLDA
jgi:ribosome-binding protein aMBF1 (putative translation factor)